MNVDSQMKNSKHVKRWGRNECEGFPHCELTKSITRVPGEGNYNRTLIGT